MGLLMRKVAGGQRSAVLPQTHSAQVFADA
jgi:hypothetical protein